jgi:glycosyltransferase involved in cell wall biosynthesis
MLCIQAGEKGWDSIEFKELYKSAVEYIGSENVIKHVVNKDENYTVQLSDLLRQYNISHFIYDPRTGSHGIWSGHWQSFKASLLFTKYDVIPVVVLTDFSSKKERSQGAIVTALRGVVYCFMSPRIVGWVFPHKRLIGPSLMPFSCDTISIIDNIIKEKPYNKNITVNFIGSLYEPRITILKKIRSNLSAHGIEFNIKGRELIRRPDIEYWSTLCFSDIVVTTSNQEYNEKVDFNEVPHLVYRYLEAMACGALLVAPDIPGIRRYFMPGVHYVSFTTSDNATEIIEYYYSNNEERIRIANQGKDRARSLIAARIFWTTLDISLGTDSIY